MKTEKPDSKTKTSRIIFRITRRQCVSMKPKPKVSGNNVSIATRTAC
jgi:hypothetical protein